MGFAKSLQQKIESHWNLKFLSEKFFFLIQINVTGNGWKLIQHLSFELQFSGQIVSSDVVFTKIIIKEINLQRIDCD